jgi:hypothetical protein
MELQKLVVGNDGEVKKRFVAYCIAVASLLYIFTIFVFTKPDSAVTQTIIGAFVFIINTFIAGQSYTDKHQITSDAAGKANGNGVVKTDAKIEVK